MTTLATLRPFFPTPNPHIRLECLPHENLATLSAPPSIYAGLTLNPRLPRQVLTLWPLYLPHSTSVATNSPT